MHGALWFLLGAYIGWRIAWGIVGMLKRRNLITIHKDRIEEWKDPYDGWA